MTLKKLMLLLGAAMALAAFAAPAAQANPEWYTTMTGGSDTTIGTTTATGHTVEFTGELASTAVGGNVVGGPCGVHAHATLWNGPNGATGEVHSLTITFPCAASSFGAPCEIEEAFSSFEEGAWPIEATTGAENVSVEGANFTNVYKGCPVIPNGVPIKAEGTATGTYNNTTTCIDFNESGDLEGASGEVTLDGSLCETTKKITLH